MKYQDCIAIYQNDPRDVHTIPHNSSPIWFHTGVENGQLFVEQAHSRTPSSTMVGRRFLPENEFYPVLSLYIRRKRGEHVSQEAQKATQNQVYWYGIFHDLDLEVAFQRREAGEV